MSDKQFYMVIYLILVVVTGLGEYFHITPTGTFSVVLGGVLGHSFGVAFNGDQKKNTPPQENP